MTRVVSRSMQHGSGGVGLGSDPDGTQLFVLLVRVLGCLCVFWGVLLCADVAVLDFVCNTSSYCFYKITGLLLTVKERYIEYYTAVN
jgi:hypothetical protein